MPWKVTNTVDKRMELVTRHQQGERATDLAREFGISRKTAMKFIARYRDVGVGGLVDQSRAPHTQRGRTSEAMESRLVRLRKRHPTWGAKKLKACLERLEPGVRVPSRSTIDEILRRHGMSESRRRRRVVPPCQGPLTHASGPNSVWAVDYKGEFRLGDGSMCYPLTSTDLATRFILGCEAYERIEAVSARECFEELFCTFGLPEVIRSDNGSPFASSRSLLGLTTLSAFWISLGIRHERIEPGHPEQNGSHERMHKTLKKETTRPAAENTLQQQERFDRFVRTFNEVRPHEALGLALPADIYRRSPRTYPPRPLEYPLHDDVATVSRDGHIVIGRARAFVGTALRGHRVGVREVEHDLFLVSFASLELGLFHRRHGWTDLLDRTDASPSAA